MTFARLLRRFLLALVYLAEWPLRLMEAIALRAAWVAMAADFNREMRVEGET